MEVYKLQYFVEQFKKTSLWNFLRFYTDLVLLEFISTPLKPNCS